MTHTLEFILGPAAHAQPDDIARGARALLHTADTAREAHTRLGSARAACWQGEAADKFRDKVSGDMLPDLDKLRVSFAAAGHTLGRYARILDDLLDEARKLLIELQAADVAAATAARDASAKAAAATTAAQRADFFGIDPETQARATRTLGLAESAATSAANAAAAANSRVADLERRAQELRDRHSDAERTAVRELDEASDAGMKDSFGSWLGNLTHDVLPVLESVADWVSKAADVISVVIVLAVVAIGAGLSAPITVPALLTALFVAGVVSLGAGIAKEGLKRLHPGDDMRSTDQKEEDAAGIALGILLTLGGGRLIGQGIRRLGNGRRAFETVDKPMRRAVSTPGRRVYIHAPRRKQLAELQGTIPSTAASQGYSQGTEPDSYAGPPAPRMPMPDPLSPPSLLPTTPFTSPFAAPSTYRYVAPAPVLVGGR